MRLLFLSFLTASVTILLWGCSLGDPAPPVDRIACIGTSITDGYILPVEQTYPPQLKALIGPPHNVLNYGVGGTTLLKKGDKPYWKAEKYTFALQWKPNIVVIEFGTNDSKKQNWVYKDEFKSDYATLINSFRQVSGTPKIYVCIPPPAFANTFDVRPDILQQEIAPLVYEVAKENNATVIDLYTPLLDKSALFPDGVHPNAEGATLIANLVYKAIAAK